MTDEDGRRAKRAAEGPDETSSGRPKRFLTPDWDDWDAASGDSPDDAPPAQGGRFASAAQEPQAAAPPGRARHSWAEDDVAGPETSSEQPPAAARPEGSTQSAGQATTGASAHSPAEPASSTEDAEASTEDAEASQTGTRAWRPIAVEPAPGASRAAQSPSLGEKRRREAPALPSTPPPTSPSERREALIARERAGRTVAPGTLPGDDWTDAPLPASAVPPPAAGQAPTPIAVHEGETPPAHHAYTRPADEGADAFALRRSPSARSAGEPGDQPEGGPGPAAEPAAPTAALVRGTGTPTFVPATPPPLAEHTGAVPVAAEAAPTGTVAAPGEAPARTEPAGAPPRPPERPGAGR
ncbi:MAG TPA: hypothetical protein VIR16_03925, partial [Candidatus Limnocylindrales bacterium]